MTSENKKTEPVTLIVTDDNRIARMMSNLFGYKTSKKGKSGINHAFYKVNSKGKDYIIISTNGHLQLFQNSTIYKWSGIDPRKIIVDPNSVIPVLNSFNKKNYYSISKLLETSNIAECIMAITPDTNSLTITLKEFGTLFKKTHPDHELRKLILFSLQPRYVLKKLDNPELFSFEDIKNAEIEYFRSYLDALISFSSTQEITYSIKQCLDADNKKFDDMKEILKKDLKERKNLLIPMSRVQALILNLIKQRNKQVQNKSNRDEFQGPAYEIAAKIAIDNEKNVEVKVNNKKFMTLEDANEALKKFKDVKHARIEKINSREKIVRPQPLFNITSLIEEVSHVLGFPTSYIYKILLDLYNAKLITYPNPDAFDIKGFNVDHPAIFNKIMALDEIECVEKQAIV
ncbi:MAG: DNA topoisomerase, partial [Candidatus Hodarchaeota archaeon]